MKAEFKKFLCEIAGFDYDYRYFENQAVLHCELEILIKAMWAINDSDLKYNITMSTDNHYLVWLYEQECLKRCKNIDKQQALTAALEYIYKETK